MTLFLQYLKTLTFRRLANIIGCEISYFISYIFKKDVVWGLPWSISIEPTTSCNLQCHQCATGAGLLSRAKGNLNLENYKTIFDKVEKHIVYLSLYFQGEPFMNPQIFDMISYARKKRVFVSSSTNGHFLTEEISGKIVDSGLNKLIISIDGMSQESYSKYRKGGDLNTVMTGLNELLLQKKHKRSSTPFIEIQFIVFKHNEHETDAIKKLRNMQGIDSVVLKTAQIIHEDDSKNLLPTHRKYSRYIKKQDGKFVIKKPVRNHCHRLRNSAVITWDGQIAPCCFDKDASYSFGNILENSFSEIYKSSTAQNFRKKILSGRKSIKICRNCNE